MPQPQEVTDLVEELLRLYRTAQSNINDQLIRTIFDPRKARRRARLLELRRSVDAELRMLERQTAEWLQGAFPRVYELGAQQAGVSIGQDFGWSQSAADAVQVLAGDTFDDVLAATTHVRSDVKAWIRQEARRQTSLSLIEGRTAEQAGRELVKAAAGEMAELLGGPVGMIRYADGSYRTLEDYSDMLLRTKTAVAFNTGTLNTLAGFGVGFVEVLDGNGCGWSSHNDGDQANGSIRTVKAAAEQPLARPRCRRSFIGRPDIETADQAKKARPSTTEAQRADQAQAEADRAARLERRRAARKTQGVRPPRQTRTARTARQPRAAARPNAATPAPAAAPPAVARVGVDPADTLTRIPSSSSMHGRPVRDSLEAIRSVHRAPEGMTPIPVSSTNASSYYGQFTAQYPAPRGNGRPEQINLSRVRNDTPASTFAHEFGHYLDHNGLGAQRDRFATLDPGENELLAGWRSAISDSAAVQRLRDLPATKTTRYLLDERELWARSYAQWISTRSGNQAMIAEVASRNAGSIATQWEADDFESIADAMDRLFDQLGLLA